VTATKRNLGASVAARLLNRSKATGDDYQMLLTSFCFERFLYRVGASGAKSRFVLKGAMLLRLWADQPYRTTRDLDLLRRGDDTSSAIRADLEAICSLDVEPDAVTFDAAGLRLEAMRAEDEHVGTRIGLPARCGTTRLTLQIDLGVGDSVWPFPQLCAYPALLEFPTPAVFAYPPEAVIAEKLEAIVVLGDRNSRIKDFFDVRYLAGLFTFDRPTLGEAVRRTLGRRSTLLPADDPIGLTRAYWDNPSRPPQVSAFARRSRLTVGADPGTELLAVLRPFLLPILDDVRQGATVPGKWPPGGPWERA
jgi:hypothetical protein